MAKGISSTLKDFLLSPAAESCYVADLFAITLASGQVLYATNGQLAITFNGNTYQPTQYGSWSCKSIETEIGAASSSAAIQLQANSDVVLAPFEASIIECIQLGLFDGALWTHYRVWMPTWGDTSMGAEVKFGGQISSISAAGRTTAEGKVEAFTFKLNQPMPRHVLQPGCRWALYSTGCTVSKAGFATSGMVSSYTGLALVPVQTIMLGSGISLAQGYVMFTSGRNTGLSIGIVGYDGTTIMLERTSLFPVEPGDTFTAYPGCAHTMAACAAFQPSTWRQNYGGTPYIPNYETAVVSGN